MKITWPGSRRLSVFIAQLVEHMHSSSIAEVVDSTDPVEALNSLQDGSFLRFLKLVGAL